MECFRSVVRVKQMGFSFKRHVQRLMWRQYQPLILMSSVLRVISHFALL